MAIYDNYYRPLVETFSPSRKRNANVNRSQDRPATNVPLVFHCTTFDDFEKIVDSGEIAPIKHSYISLTEIPIGELDRMKIRRGDEPQIAIGFPRFFMQAHGFAPVFYSKYQPEFAAVIQTLFNENHEFEKQFGPYLEQNDDVGAFQEIRTLKSVPLENAVWLLSTERDDSRSPIIPKYDEFKDRFGDISRSFWHRSHQMGVLDEFQFIRFEYEKEEVANYSFKGEFYADQPPPDPNEYLVQLADSKRMLSFRSVEGSDTNNYPGPMRFIDVAHKIFDELSKVGKVRELLPYRQIERFPVRGK